MAATADSTNILLHVFIEKKNLNTSAPAQFKSVLFKGQLYISCHNSLQIGWKKIYYPHTVEGGLLLECKVALTFENQCHPPY